MPANPSKLISRRVVQVCLFLVAAITMFGGALQMYLGEPEILLRLNNVHRSWRMCTSQPASSTYGRHPVFGTRAPWCICLPRGCYLLVSEDSFSSARLGYPIPRQFGLATSSPNYFCLLS